MLLQLTNANQAHYGNSLLINSDMILSVYRSLGATVVDDDTVENVEDVTYIFCPPHGTWEVQETPEQILDLIAGKSLSTLTVVAAKPAKADEATEDADGN
jgi:hypothetical protein